MDWKRLFHPKDTGSRFLQITASYLPHCPVHISRILIFNRNGKKIPVPKTNPQYPLQRIKNTETQTQLSIRKCREVQCILPHSLHPAAPP
jgi:hypothetical protein